MSYFIFLLFFVHSLTVINFYKDEYLKAVIFHIFSMSLLLFSSMLLLIKTSTFSASYGMNYYLVLLAKHLRLPLSSISFIVTIFLAVTAFSIFSIFISPIKTRLKKIHYFLFFLPMLFFAILNHPNISYLIYLKSIQMNLATASSEQFITIISAILLLFYIVSPFVLIPIKIKQTECLVKKLHYRFILTTLGMIVLLLLSLIRRGPLLTVFLSCTSFIKLSSNTINNDVFTLATLFLFFATIYCISFILHKNKPTKLKKLPHILFGFAPSATNLRMVLHAYKNLFFTIEQLTNILKQYLHDNNIQKADKIANMIEDLSHNTVKTLYDQLEMLSDLKFNHKLINICSLIKESSERASTGSSVKLDYNFSKETIWILGDRFHISEAFYNIISNSVAAIDIKQLKDNGIINISINDNDDDWICVNIIDNGCGIPKKNLHKIFNMLFSTKQAHGNCGVGLYYVKKVITAHTGKIYVHSEENIMTDFKIFIPKVLSE